MSNKSIIVYRVKKNQNIYDIYIFDFSKPVIIYKTDYLISYKFELNKNDYIEFKKMIKDKKLALACYIDHKLSYLAKIILQYDNINIHSFCLDRWKNMFTYLKEYSIHTNKFVKIYHPFNYKCNEFKKIIDYVDNLIESKLDFLIEVTKVKE